MLRKYICIAVPVLLALASCQSSAPNCTLPCPSDEPYVEQKCLHKYGIEVQPDYWVDCGRNGQLITTQRNGVVITQTFASGFLNGQTTITFPHSNQAERIEMYENDQLISEYIYQPSGIPISCREYSAPDIYTETIWYENGNPKCIEKFERGLLINGEYFSVQNKRDAWVSEGYGERINRDALGTLLSTDTFKGGALASKLIQYPNGTPKEVISFTNDQIDGVRKTYYSGGEPMNIESWSGGQQHGLTTTFQNGEKYSDVFYVNGRKSGIESRYKDGSTVTQEITWNNGVMHGPCHTYYGENVQTDWYYNGKLSSRANFESFAVPRKGS